jgi:hypothetical protein
MSGGPQGRPVRGVVCLWTALGRWTLAGCSIPRFSGGPRSPSCPELQGRSRRCQAGWQRVSAT